MASLVSGEVSPNELKELVQRLSLYPVPKHTFHEQAAGPLGLVDLPTYDMPAAGIAKCVVEILMDVDGPVPHGQIKEALSSGSGCRDLPEPYGLKSQPLQPYLLDIAVLPQVNGKHCVVKIINFKEKMKIVDVRAMTYSTPRMVDWQNNVKNMKKVLHHIFENLGGHQCRNHVLRSHEEGKPDAEKSEAEWNFGFDFIEENGPRDNIKNKQLRWVTIQTSTPDMDNKPVGKIYRNLEVARARHVRMKEKDVLYGSQCEWPDVEADEVDLGKELVLDASKAKWEQWGGIVERGRPDTLMLFRLKPRLTTPRSPGPGAIRRRDWEPIARKHLLNRSVVLHTDGARAYKLKLPGVLHDNVVHKKKKIQVNGKNAWVRPHYTKICSHTLPERHTDHRPDLGGTFAAT